MKKFISFDVSSRGKNFKTFCLELTGLVIVNGFKKKSRNSPFELLAKISSQKKNGLNYEKTNLSFKVGSNVSVGNRKSKIDLSPILIPY